MEDFKDPLTQEIIRKDKNNSSFFSKRGNIILLIAGMIIILALVIILSIALSGGQNKDKDKEEHLDISFSFKSVYLTQEANSTIKLINRFPFKDSKYAEIIYFSLLVIEKARFY